MSWEANEWARKQRTGDPVLKNLLMMLSNYANEDSECWHSQARISFDTEIPIRTLRRKLQDLAALGLIEITQRIREDGTKTTSLIRLLLNPAATVADGDEVQRPKEGGTVGQNGGSPSATWLAEQESPRTTGISKESTRAQAERFFDERFWPAFPKREGSNPKEPAKKKFVALVVGGENPEAILAGALQYEQDLRRRGDLNTRFVKQCLVWLNGKGWRDDPESRGGSPRGGPPRNDGPQRSFFSVAQETMDKFRQ
jgi:hypothetical protein